MPFELEPGAVALVALMATLYARAVAVLRRRGYDVPTGQRAAWWLGLFLVAAGLIGPVDALPRTWCSPTWASTCCSRIWPPPSC